MDGRGVSLDLDFWTGLNRASRMNGLDLDLDLDLGGAASEAFGGHHVRIAFGFFVSIQDDVDGWGWMRL